MRRFLLAATAAAAVLSCSTVQAATWSVSTFDMPGSTFTQPFGINDSGVIVGGSDFGGFIDTHGSFQTVNGPAGPGSLTGISDSGLAVGGQAAGNSFFYQGGVFTPFAVPSALDTEIRGISANGRYIAGTYDDASGTLLGFVWDRSTSMLSTITPSAGAHINVVQGVNDEGVATGSLDNNEALVFDSKTGTSTYFGSWGGLTKLRFRAINDDGQVGGWAVGPDGNFVGIIGNPATGFDTIDFGVDDATVVYGLNDSGQAVGFYTDAAGLTHGFVASSVPEPASAALLVAGMLAVGSGLARRARRDGSAG